MFKFGRFKTSFNVYSGNKSKAGKGHDDFSSVTSINGAYRTNRDEFFIYGNNSEPQSKTKPAAPAAPAPPAPPPPPQTSTQPTRPIRQTKSTSDLIKEQNLPPNLRGAQSGVSLDPRGAETDNNNSRTKPADTKNNKTQLDAHRRLEKQRLEEQKKLEKQRLAEQKKLDKQRADEQKKRDKLEQQERAKQEKLRKEREKKEAKLAKKNNKKGKAPQKPLANPLAQSRAPAAGTNQPVGNQPSSAQYSTNTLESSISKSSGPPPYAENIEQQDGNVSFSKPVDTGSWDMVSQHRQNINRHVTKGPAPKAKVTTMDLNYTLGDDSKVNSEA